MGINWQSFSQGQAKWFSQRISCIFSYIQEDMLLLNITNASTKKGTVKRKSGGIALRLIRKITSSYRIIWLEIKSKKRMMGMVRAIIMKLF